MSLPEVRISGRGMEITDAIQAYIEEKLNKYERIFNVATAIQVECIENIAARGVKDDFRVEISMTLPRTVVRVEKFGSDIYAIVDEATDVLSRKVKRYKDKLRQWEGKDSWKVDDMSADGKDADIVEESGLVDYVPKIMKRKKIEDCMPVSEAEAIEKMEMMGYNCFLFKSKKTGKFSMIYRRRKSGYGIVEPCEE